MRWSEGSLLPPSPTVPRPRSAIVRVGSEKSFVFTVSVADTTPLAVAVNSTSRLIDWPAASVVGRVGAPTRLKRAAPPPVIEKASAGRAIGPLPVLVIVIRWARPGWALPKTSLKCSAGPPP